MKLNASLFILLLTALPALSRAQAPSAPSQGRAQEDSLFRYLGELAPLEPGTVTQQARDLQQSALESNDSSLLARSLSLEAQTHLSRHRFGQASNRLNSALDIYRSIGDKAGQTRSLRLLADIESFTGQYYAAILKLEQALQLSTDGAERSDILSGLARLKMKQGEMQQALHHAQQALKEANARNDRLMRGQLYNLLAEINTETGELTKARDYLKNAALINRGMGQTTALAETKSLEARLWRKQKNNTEATRAIREALELSQTSGSPYQYARHLLYYSELLSEQGRTDEALQAALKADSVAGLKTPLPILSRQITSRVAHSLMEAGDSVNALRKWLSFQAIDDSIRQHDWQKLLLKRKVEQQEAGNAELTEQNELKEKLLERSRVLLLLAGGLIVVFVLLIGVLVQNLLRKKRFNKELQKQSKTINEQREVVTDKERELEEKNKKLEELDKTKNKLFSVLTHDLRQPLTQIKSVLNLFEEENLTEEERMAMITKLKESVDNSSNALENLLLWSKKQLTGFTTKVVDVHLLPQVWQLESQVGPNMKSKNLELDIRIPDFFKIKADMNQLDICLRNLVNNAIKFSNPGGKIIIETSETEDEKILSVRDNGVGMDEDQLRKLRDLSENFTTIGTMNEKGTGLGIMIVHEFMQNQNGRLQIDSRKGQGSTFSLVFPKINGKEVSREEAAQVSEK